MGIQNGRFYRGLRNDYRINLYYRDFSGKKEIIHDGENFLIPVKSLNLKLVDFILARIFPSLIQIMSFDELLWSILCFVRIIKNRTKFDLVYVTFNPFPVFFTVFLLKRRYNKKTISHFHDPLLDNIYVRKSSFGLPLRKLIERQIVKHSDIILTTNKLLLDRLKQRYFSEKVIFGVVPLCTDLDLKLEASNGLNKKITLVHAGNLYGLRNIHLLNEVVLILSRRYANLSDVFQVEMYGSVADSDKKLVEESGIQDIVLFLGTLNKEELYPKLSSADALLVIDALESENLFFPSKLCEYLILEKIIFAITPLISVTRDHLLRSGHLAFGSTEISIFVESLSKIIENRCFYENSFDSKYYKSFLPSVAATEFKKLIDTQKL